MYKKKEIDYKIIITGLVCITVLEIVALMKGINGFILTSVIAIIALALGISIPNPIQIKKTGY